jgi:hypothetical protein
MYNYFTFPPIQGTFLVKIVFKKKTQIFNKNANIGISSIDFSQNCMDE